MWKIKPFSSKYTPSHPGNVYKERLQGVHFHEDAICAKARRTARHISYVKATDALAKMSPADRRRDIAYGKIANRRTFFAAILSRLAVSMRACASLKTCDDAANFIKSLEPSIGVISPSGE